MTWLFCCYFVNILLINTGVLTLFGSENGLNFVYLFCTEKVRFLSNFIYERRKKESGLFRG